MAATELGLGTTVWALILFLLGLLVVATTILRLLHWIRGSSRSSRS